jgi:hypothetical protein
VRYSVGLRPRLRAGRLRGAAAAATVFALAAGLLPLAAGCNGSRCSGQGFLTRALRVRVEWDERSRDIRGLSSALWAEVIVTGANPDGGDLRFIVRRRTEPPRYSEVYRYDREVRLGTWPIRMEFHSLPEGGDITGIAQAVVTIDQADKEIADLTTVGLVASVEVPPNQVVQVGETRDLIFTARDAGGRIFALTPGAAFWDAEPGQLHMRLRPDGQATGLTPGPVSVTARVDGVTSPPSVITVDPGQGGANIGIRSVQGDLPCGY